MASSHKCLLLMVSVKRDYPFWGPLLFFGGEGRVEYLLYIRGNMHHAMVLTCWGNLNDLHPEVKKSPSKNWPSFIFPFQG